MKKIVSVVAISSVVFLFSACNGEKKASDNQSVSQSANQPATQSASKDETKAADQTKPADSTAARGTKSEESLTGTQLVENATNRLVTKLEMTSDQASSLKILLAKVFTGEGEDLNKTYTADQSRTIGRDIIVKGTDQIMLILNDKQKEVFKRFGQH